MAKRLHCNCLQARSRPALKSRNPQNRQASTAYWNFSSCQLIICSRPKNCACFRSWCAVIPASQIPAAGKRRQEGYFWAIRLTRRRKSDGTRTWRRSAGWDEHAKPNAVQGLRDMAKAGLLEPQTSAVESHTPCHGVTWTGLPIGAGATARRLVSMITSAP